MASQSGLPPLPPWGTAVAGSTGAVIANALVYPLDMCAYTHRFPIAGSSTHVDFQVLTA